MKHGSVPKLVSTTEGVCMGEIEKPTLNSHYSHFHQMLVSERNVVVTPNSIKHNDWHNLIVRHRHGATNHAGKLKRTGKRYALASINIS